MAPRRSWVWAITAELDEVDRNGPATKLGPSTGQQPVVNCLLLPSCFFFQLPVPFSLQTLFLLLLYGVVYAYAYSFNQYGTGALNDNGGYCEGVHYDNDIDTADYDGDEYDGSDPNHNDD